ATGAALAAPGEDVVINRAQEHAQPAGRHAMAHRGSRAHQPHAVDDLDVVQILLPGVIARGFDLLGGGGHDPRSSRPTDGLQSVSGYRFSSVTWASSPSSSSSASAGVRSAASSSSPR